MINQFLTPNRILPGINVRDWGHLVEVVGGVLVEAGDVEHSYVKAMKRIIVDMGPYCVIAPGVALLHARPEAGVKRLCLALATVPEGVRFGSPNDPVYVAFALGALDHESHIDLLSEVAKLLNDKRNIEALRNARSVKEISAVINGAAPET